MKTDECGHLYRNVFMNYNYISLATRRNKLLLSHKCDICERIQEKGEFHISKPHVRNNEPP